MMDLPSVLQTELRRRRNDQPARARVGERTSRVSRGDLRVTSPFEGSVGDPRLALVLSVDSDRDFVEIMLVHTAPELACQVDAVIEPTVSAAAYPIVIETDVRGVVWTWQLGRMVGHMGEELLTALGAVAGRSQSGDFSATRSVLATGTALAGPSDPRWSFKKAEGEALRVLAGDCTEALLDEGSPWIVDPGLLRPELLDLATDPAAVLQDLIHWVATRPLEMSTSDAEHLLELGVLELDAWTNVGDIGPDVLISLQALVERAATRAAPGDRNSASRRWVTAMHLESSTHDARREDVHYLGEKERAAA